MSNIKIIQGDFEKKLQLSLAPSIMAGFPSPADDYQNDSLDFNRDLIRHPEATFYGKVIEKGVTADPLSRTYDVKLLVDNPDHKLLPGMICQVYSRFSRGQMSVFVPAKVVQINPDNRMCVWIV